MRGNLSLELVYDVQGCELQVCVPRKFAPHVFHALHKWALVGGSYSVRKPSADDVAAGTVRIAVEDKSRGIGRNGRAHSCVYLRRLIYFDGPCHGARQRARTMPKGLDHAKGPGALHKKKGGQ